MHRHILAPLLACLFLTSAAFADEALKITGAIDMHYEYNFNGPRPVAAPTDTALTQPAGNNRYRVFDQYHDNLNLSLVQVNFEKRRGQVAAKVALGFGHTADTLSPRDEVSKNVLEAILTFTPAAHPRLEISAGKMYTHMGLEIAPTKANWNYSRSVLFGFAIPLWHTGLAAKYALDGPSEQKLALFVYNETIGLYGVEAGKTYGAQWSGKFFDENLGLTYNLLGGRELSGDGISHNRTLHELVPTWTINDKLQANGDIIYGEITNARTEQTRNAYFTAFSVGLKYTEGAFSLSPRFENYTDRSGATIETATSTKPSLPQRIESYTLTGAWDLGDGLETRLEARHDRSSSDTFVDGNDEPKTSQTTLLLGMLYDF